MTMPADGPSIDGARSGLLHLRFRDAALESRFQQSFYHQHRLQNQLTAVFGVLVYILFAVVDWRVGGDNWRQIVLVRLGITLPPLMLVASGLFLPRLAAHHTGPLVFGMMVIAGGGITIMNTLLPAQAHNLYFTGLLLVLLFGHAFSRVGVRWPTTATVLIFVFYLAAVRWLQPVQPPYLLASVFYYVAASGIMIYNSWAMEQHERNGFLMERKLWRLAHTDELTGLANRRAFIEHFDREWRRARREGERISLLLVDLDHLKQINDLHGHDQGDATLKRLAAALGSRARRPGDLAARFGGDEFTLLLIGASDERACGLARELARLEDADGSLRTTITTSIGMVSVIPHRENSPEWLLKEADSALYQAKREGRARAVCRRL